MLVAVNLSRAWRCKVSNFLDSTLFVYANVLPNLLWGQLGSSFKPLQSSDRSKQINWTDDLRNCICLEMATRNLFNLCKSTFLLCRSSWSSLVFPIVLRIGQSNVWTSDHNCKSHIGWLCLFMLEMFKGTHCGFFFKQNNNDQWKSKVNLHSKIPQKSSI